MNCMQRRALDRAQPWEMGNMLGSGFWAAREMILLLPGRLRFGWLQKAAASHVLKIPTWALQATIRLCLAPGQPGFGVVKSNWISVPALQVEEILWESSF